MASIHSVTNGDTGKYVDIDGHRVRKYDLRLSRIPQLDYNDPQVESIIANEVSLTTTYTVSAQVFAYIRVGMYRLRKCLIHTKLIVYLLKRVKVCRDYSWRAWVTQ